MAIRQVGGAPVYVIDVETPKPTDSRGRGYGMLVSDLRWKLWEEVQNSQLQQMKFDQLNRQAQLDVLEQQQRDISRAIRNANELKAEIKAGKISGGGAANRLGTKTITEKEEDIIDVVGDKTGEKKITKTTRVTVPTGKVAAATDTTAALAQQQAQFDEQQAALDQYISEQEAEQAALGQKFAALAGQPIGPDILTRSREAFQTQIGEGGFGISRRPFRQVPRFDETQAVGRIQDTLAREESALINEALKRKSEKSQNAKNRIAEVMAMGQEDEMTGALLAELNRQAADTQLSLDEERRVRELARQKLAEQMTQAGAEPTSRAGFLMKPPPAYEGLLPREETRVPTGRLRDDFGVEGRTTLDRKAEILRDIIYDPPTFLPEIIDQDAIARATKRGDVSETPVEYSVRRNLELDAMGEPPVYDVNFPPTIEDTAAREVQEKIDTARLARDRGFNLPVEDISGFRQTVMGRPGGMADESVVRRLIKNREEAAKQADEAIKQADEALRVSREPEPPKAPSRFNLPTLDASGMPISPKPGGKVEDLGSEQEPQAKLTVPQRRDLYAMRTVKQGLELADKPKQFARVAKTETPDKAPEYVKLVNGIYDINAAKPNRFKLTYDEISRALKNDPATRQKAHAYLVAKDALESNVQNPLA